MKTIRRLLELNNKTKLILFASFNILYIGIAILDPYFVSCFIDKALDGDIHGILLFIVIMVFTWILEQTTSFCYDIFRGKCEAITWEKYVSRAEKCILGYDPRNGEIATSDVEQQLGQNYELVKDFISYYPVELLGKTLQEIGIAIALIIISPINGIMALTFIPFFVVLSAKYGDKMAEYGDLTVEAMADCRNHLVDLSKLSFTERFRTNSRLVSVGGLIDKYQKRKKTQTKSEAIFTNFLSYAFLNLMVVLSLIVSGIQVYRGKQTIGELYAIQLYVSQFWTPIEFFVDFYKDYASKKKILQDFLTFFDRKMIDYCSKPIKSIELIDYVSLSADNKRLHLPITTAFIPGKIYYVIGDNGVGKTSLILAILGLSSRYEGTIKFNGFGNNNEFMYSAADPVISKFDKNNIEQNMSMGQMKLEQLNSDFAEDKEVYFFDEPTNYLDTNRKGEVYEKLIGLAQNNKIVIVITHDMNLINRAERIIEMSSET